MSKINNGGPAFPVLKEIKDQNRRGKDFDALCVGGMSLRDWFAGQALSLFSLGKEEVEHIQRGIPRPQHDVAARFCYELADAMLKERER